MVLLRSSSQRLSYSQCYLKRVRTNRKRRPEESKGTKESEGASVPAPVQTEALKKKQQDDEKDVVRYTLSQISLSVHTLRDVVGSGSGMGRLARGDSTLCEQKCQSWQRAQR